MGSAKVYSDLLRYNLTYCSTCWLGVQSCKTFFSLHNVPNYCCSFPQSRGLGKLGREGAILDEKRTILETWYTLYFFRNKTFCLSR